MSSHTHSNTSPPPLPHPANPPAHRFSTVIYPSVSVLRAETGSDVLEGLHYGRLGSPAARRLEALLTRRSAAHGCVLPASRTAALVAATAAWLSAGDVVAAPASTRPETIPVLDALLPKLGVSVVRYRSLHELRRVADEMRPRVFLVEAPVPPLFDAAVGVAELPRVRDTCGSGAVLVLDNVGDIIAPAEALSQGVDVVVSSADRCGGLLDGNSSLQFGVLLCGSERSYRRMRAAVRGRHGPTAGAPNAEACLKAEMASRSAEVRREAQKGAVRKVIAALESGVMGPDMKQYETFPGALDIGIELRDVDTFLDRLQLVRIGDGVGGGNSTSFIWPCWADSAADSSAHSSWIILSVGLEHPDEIVRDLQQAAQPS